MANIGNILHGILDVAGKVAPLLGPAGAAGAAAATALNNLIEQAKAAAGPEHGATVEQLTALQAQVNAHAHSVIDDLRGPASGGTDTHG
jgi:hypothetical protein